MPVKNRMHHYNQSVSKACFKALDNSSRTRHCLFVLQVGSGMLQLASAHGPLVLIAQGILLDLQLPNASEVSLSEFCIASIQDETIIEHTFGEWSHGPFVTHQLHAHQDDCQDLCALLCSILHAD